MKKLRQFIGRFLARAAVVAYLGWDAGQRWKPERGTLGFPFGGPQTPDEANTPQDRCEIIRKSQQLERNNWFAIALGEVWVTYTVGSGLPIRAASSDKEWNDRRNAKWQTWCEFPDLISTQDFDSWQCMVAWRVFYDGAGYIYKTRGETAPFRPRVQFIEAASVQTPPELADRADIFDGVERNSLGRHVAYWVKQVINGEEKFKRIPARDIIPICDFTRPGETHSFPYVAGVLEDIQDLKELAGFAMVKAKDAADITNVFETIDGDIPTSQEYGRSRFTVSSQTAGGTTTESDRIKQIRKSLGPRQISLKTGEKVSQLRAESPNEIEQEHWNTIVDRVCAGARIPKLLVIPESIQGTVARAILDNANTYFKGKSKMIQRALVEVWRFVTWEESMFDPDIADKPADWRRCTIRNPRGCNVDVGRNSNAMLAELDAGATTFDDVYGPLGEDKWERLEERFKEEKWLDEKAKEYGVPVERIRKSVGETMKLQMQADATAQAQDDAAIPSKPSKPQRQKQAA
jgi:capsid protein